MVSNIGASPPWHTSTMDPASLLGSVVDDTFSVRSPLGALAMSSTVWPCLCVTP